MVTFDEIRQYLTKKHKRELTSAELISIFNGMGLITLKEAIEEAKREQKKDRLV